MISKKGLFAVAIASALGFSVPAYAQVFLAGNPAVDLNADTPAALATNNLSFTFGGATDAIAGSTIEIIAPDGTKFSVKPSGAPGANSNLTLDPAFPVELSTDSRTVTWTVLDAAAAGDSFLITAPSLIFDSTSAGTDMNEEGLQFEVITNGGSSIPTDPIFIGDIAVLQQPEIVSAVLVSDTAVDVFFDVGLKTGDTVGTLAEPIESNVGTAAGSDIDFIIGGSSITNGTGKVSLDADNSKLVHITDIEGSISAGHTIAFNSDSTPDTPTLDGGIITNALGAVHSVDTVTAVPINPTDSAVSAVNLTEAVRVGSTLDAFNTSNTYTADMKQSNEFEFVVTGTAGATVSVRAQKEDGSTIGDTGILFDEDTNTTGEDTSFLIPGSGTLNLFGRVGASQLVAADSEGKIAVAVSVDGTTWVSSPADSITIDRKQPGVASAEATDRNTIVATLSEPIVSEDATNKNADGDPTPTSTSINADTNFTIGGIGPNANAELQFSLDISYDDNVTVTLKTGLLGAATDNTLALDMSAHDLAGNKGDDVASESFNTEGVSLDSATLGDIHSSAEAGVTKINDADIIVITVEGPSGQSNNITARFVNLDDSNNPDHITTGGLNLTEITAGIYEGHLTLTSTDLAEGTRLGVQFSADSFAQHIDATGNVFTVDNTAPTLTSATPQGNQATKLMFSESMVTTVGDILDKVNYGIDNGIAISKVDLISDTEVLLVHSAVTEGTEYTVTLTGTPDIKDLTHNVFSATANTAEFTGTEADTEAPTGSIAGGIVGTGVVVMQLDDNNGVGNIDIGNANVISVTVNGDTVGFTIETDAALGKVTLTLANVTLETDDEIEVTIQVSDRAGNDVTIAETITVSGEVLSFPETASVFVGETIMLEAVSGTAESFASSDENIATVDDSGEVTGVAAGEVTITATDAVGSTAETTVTVNPEGALIVDKTAVDVSGTGGTATVTVTGGEGALTISNSDDAVATATLAEGELTITGVGNGTTTVTITDAGEGDAQQTVKVMITVTGAVSAGLTDMGETSSANADGSPGDAHNAKFHGGAANKDGVFGSAFVEADKITMDAFIEVDPNDVGKEGSFYVVVSFDFGDGILFFYKGPEVGFQSPWVNWSGNFSDLEAVDGIQTLEPTKEMPIITNLQLAAGEYNVWVGYNVEGGDFKYHNFPIEITVSN